MRAYKKYKKILIILTAMLIFFANTAKADNIMQEADSIRAELETINDKKSEQYIKTKQKLDRIIQQNRIDYSLEARFKDALRLIGEEKYNSAIYELKSLIEQNYQVSKCYELLGDICEKRNKPIKKIGYYYNLAYDNDKTNYTAATKLANLYVQEDKSAPAISFISRAVDNCNDPEFLKLIAEFVKNDISPKNKLEANSLYDILGNIYLKLGMKEEAYNAYKMALQLNPEDIFLKYKLANLYYCKEEDRSAVAVYDNILNENPKETAIRTSKAKALASLGNILSADKEYRKILEYDPKSIQARYGLYKLYEGKFPPDKLLTKIYSGNLSYVPTKQDILEFSKLLESVGDNVAANKFKNYVKESEQKEREEQQQRILAQQYKEQENLRKQQEIEAERERQRQLEAEKLRQKELASKQLEMKLVQENLAKQKEQELLLKQREEERLRQETLARKKAEQEEIARKKAQEEAILRQKQQEELAKRRTEQEALARKKAEQEAILRQKQQEAEKLRQEEIAKKKAEEERLRQEEIARKEAEQEALLKQKQQEERLRQEEIARKKAQEEAILRQKQQEELAKKKAEEERLRQEEIARKKAEQEAILRQKQQEERLRQEEIARKKAQEEAILRQKQQEELARKKAEEERLKQEELAKKKAEEERLRQEEIARKKAQEEALLKQKQQEERLRQEEIARKKAEQQELARKKAETEAKKKEQQEQEKKAKLLKQQKEYEERTIAKEKEKSLSKDSRKYKKLESEINKYLAMEPKDANTYIAIANTYKQMEMPTNALKYYKEAQKLDPTNSDIYYNLGLTYMELNSLVTSKANLIKAINLNKDNSKAKNLLGFVNQKLITKTINDAFEKFEAKNYVSAFEILDTGIKEYPKSGQLYYYRALVFDKMNRNAAQIIDLQKAVEYDPGYYMAYYQLGLAYEKINDGRSALYAYEKFLSTEPEEKDLIQEVQKKVENLSKKYY